MNYEPWKDFTVCHWVCDGINRPVRDGQEYWQCVGTDGAEVPTVRMYILSLNAHTCLTSLQFFAHIGQTQTGSVMRSLHRVWTRCMVIFFSLPVIKPIVSAWNKPPHYPHLSKSLAVFIIPLKISTQDCRALKQFTSGGWIDFASLHI